ncbi:MAG: hypothetical protein GY842_10980 [bacterium]|nr:hypothetical protein [bacterium]
MNEHVRGCDPEPDRVRLARGREHIPARTRECGSGPDSDSAWFLGETRERQHAPLLGLGMKLS